MFEFFVNRPIVAMVIAILMMLVGFICIFLLPIAQFPQITPPQVQVNSTYTGASSSVISEQVTTPLEEQINGVEGMIYMSSVSNNNGNSSITVTFNVGYDLDIAAVDTQNNADVAKPLLPDTVLRNGVVVNKVSTNMVLIVNLFSPNGTYDEKFLGNYADIHITNVLQRIPGVGTVTNYGLMQYAIRVWLDPDKLANLSLTTNDVLNAINEQNAQVAAGIIGSPPAPSDQDFTYQVNTKGRLTSVKDFEDIIVRRNSDGALVRIKDLGSVELGGNTYSISSLYNGKDTASLGIYQLPNANAIQISNSIHAAMADLAKRFPKDIAYNIAYDTTNFVKASLIDVVKTFFEALFLVFLVVYIFLQNWRATLIPCIAIPVSLIGTFGLLKAFGFSINTLSLLGMVLAIGLVVDDAIVVVENVYRQVEESGKSIKAATLAAMDEVKGPIVATTLVLMAVFVPVAFMPGLTGQLYNQFALTIAFSVGLSGINSLTLSPSLCALILKGHHQPSFKFFIYFNDGFERASEVYRHGLNRLLTSWKYVVLGFIGLCILTYALFKILPTGFIPDEDQGYFIVSFAGQPATSLQRTQTVSMQAQKILEKLDGVQDIVFINGYNLIDSITQPNYAVAFVVLKPWDDRKSKALNVNQIMKLAQERLNALNNVHIAVLNPSPIPGLGSTGGFQFQIQDLDSLGIETLAKVTTQFIQEANKQPQLSRVFTTFSTETPQLWVDLDREKAKTLGININDIFQTLQVYLGSLYIDNFNKYGKTYQVLVQAMGDKRSKVADIQRLYVRNDQGKMVPLSALTTIKNITGPYNITHYNLYDSTTVNGSAAPGYSSGQALKTMEKLAKQLFPSGIGYEWTGVALQQKQTGNLAPFIFLLSLVFVFLFLSALYESWSMPFIVLLSVPLALLGAATALLIRGLQLDVYAQIGLVMLIGLAAKNAILIVEFAKQKREAGEPIVQAALDAAKLRLRPILMTAFAFIFGVIPLMTASGAGASSRHSIGTTVVGGMLCATFLTLIIVPTFYVIIEKMRERREMRKNLANHDADEIPQ
jgi:HAE1 family hydrophobic/amphiphilic exporter-1